MESGFEIIDHTADIGLRAWGADLTEAFANTARGMFSLVTDLESIRESVIKELNVKAPDREVLLVEWLNEMLFYFDTEGLLFNRFEIFSLSGNEINSRCFGEKVDRSRHELKRGIKSTTYHMLKIEEKDDQYRIQVLFDI
jgi:SHS2 domain-containing protein